MITQIICHYLPPTPERLNELCVVLENNIANKYISKIISFVEDICLQTSPWPEAEKMRTLLNNDKITTIRTHKRQSYSSLIDYANTNIDNIALISNSDIYYDDTLQLLSKIDFSKTTICLSKIEIIDKNGSLFRLTDEMKSYSQDSWFFKPPININNADFTMGIQRCDNRIAYEFKSAGYHVINPANNINSYHFHLSQTRTYRKDIDCIPGPVYFVQPPYYL